MNDLRPTISWLLLVMVAVVGGGGAVLGLSQAPSNVPLAKAVTNTLDAASYSQVLTESTAQGKQADYLTYEAPDKLGGYVQSGKKRTYVYVIGTTEYQSLTVTSSTPTKHLVFYKQESQGVQALDPVHNYLKYASEAKNVTKSGSTYSFTLTQQGQVGKFTYTVTGNYISGMTLSVQGASIQLVISQVGTAPPVALPAGAKVVGLPAGASG